jgi:hypothetical protein
VYSHIATGTVAAGIPTAAAASGFAPVHVVVGLAVSAAAMTGLISVLRFVHRGA